MGTIQVPSTENIEVSRCIKCGGDDVFIGDCGYSSFNVAYGKCQNKQCKHEVKFNCGWNISEKEIVEAWNRENDIDLLLEKKYGELLQTRSIIAELKKLKKQLLKTK